MNKKAVVIGAGQTGRGYGARYLFEKGYDITFIDINEKLVADLKEDRAFSIHFYNRDRTPVYMHGFETFLPTEDGAKKALFDADIVLTAVGEQNLGDVAKVNVPSFKGKTKRTVFITCENGTNPAKVLRNHLIDEKLEAPYVVSQTAVFCSTVVVDKTRLDILSQNETYFPYDHDELESLDFDGAVPVRNFEKFFERKIYTYNCLAGLISYCGYVKGYEVYGDAAVDPDVSGAMDQLLESLNPALQKYFEITEEDQVAFANKALGKFKDLNILDYTVKNGRAPRRKLGPTERIISPIRIIENNHGDTRILEFVAAAALTYWVELEGKSEPMIGMSPIEAFMEINGFSKDDPIVENVAYYYDEIQKNRANINVLDIVNSRN